LDYDIVKAHGGEIKVAPGEKKVNSVYRQFTDLIKNNDTPSLTEFRGEGKTFLSIWRES
jgi:hypothetical protein